MSNLEYNLDSAFQFAHKIESIYNFFCAVRSSELNFVNKKFDVWHNTIQNNAKDSISVFSVLTFEPSNCYPEKNECSPNDDMWFDCTCAEMDMVAVPDDFEVQDLTEEWWFQQNLVHEDIDLFFYAVFKILYKNNIVKESIYFSCTYLDELYKEIKTQKPVS